MLHRSLLFVSELKMIKYLQDLITSTS